MKFIAIIPARFGSSRFEGKPLADIFGRPMIEHVYKRAQSEFETVVVATDDSRIEDVVKGFGGEVVMTSTEHRSGTDRALEALRKCEQIYNQKYDVVINIQGDEPFVSADQLKDIKSCFDSPSVEIATLVKKFEEGEDIFNPNSPKVVLSSMGEALYFSRSVIPHLRGHQPEQWSKQHTYYKHIGLYGYRCDILAKITSLAPSSLEIAESLEQLRWLEAGYRIATKITDTQSHAIDTPEDLAMVLDLYADRFSDGY